ncbi:MAG: GNAT family N-acetyltransferase [Bacteroidetes bacterium]|nr:GNAT family N-acetyltransferase [Bacteroidota bacterium]
MSKVLSLNDITIRTNLVPGDIGYITYLHGDLYHKEYGIECETYIAEGLIEFYKNYNANMDGVWVCEHNGKIMGTLFLMHRDKNTAQLRYFLILPEYRGIGLGKKLMSLYMDLLHKRGYTSSYLWTINELYAASSLYKRHGFTLTEEIESTAFVKPVKEQRYDLILK